jgi:shikimate dehydrogenase
MAACLARRAGAVGRGLAVLVGAGGSTAAMLEALRRVPAARAVVMARRLDQAEALVARVRPWTPFPVEARSLPDGARLLHEATLIVNATALGVQEDDPSPVPRAALRPGVLVYDVIYRRTGLTRLQADAVAAGALVCDGLCHLFEQGPLAFGLLTGQDAPRAAMLEGLVAATGRPLLHWGSEAG